MFRYVVRVWLPDRPGALGQVASRIGAVRGDVVGIEILERGAGRAVDELIVALPEPDLVDLLVGEIGQVDGVDVEDVRPLSGEPHEPELDALAAAARIVEADPDSWIETLVAEAGTLLGADWAVALAGQPLVTIASSRAAGAAGAADGTMPDDAWLVAFVEGARHLPDDIDVGPDDVAWSAIGRSGAVVAIGRQHRPLRWRERRTLTLLARVADASFGQPAGGSSSAAGAAQPRERSTARHQPA